MFKPGDVIPASTRTGSFSVIGWLGEGTCCEVYKVCAVIQPCEKKALKVFKPGVQFSHAHDAEAMLLNLVLRANGPCRNLVKTYADFDHEEQPCLLQELLDFDLRQIVTLSQGQGLSLYLIQKLTRDILCGIEHLHRSGFVHADIKPTNLLWSPRDGCIKIIDFSLSFHVQDNVTHRIQSSGYRAPEVDFWNASIADDGKIRTTNTGETLNQVPIKPSKACDLWSVACVVMEMLAGGKVFTQEKLIELQQLVKEGSSYSTLLSELIDSLVECQPRDDNIGTFNLLGDFLKCLLSVDVGKRLTATEAIKHEFFKASLSPVFRDFCLLPSTVLRMLNVVESQDLEDESAYSDLVLDLTEQCSKYGTVLSCVVPRSGSGAGKAFVEYRDWGESKEAYSKLCRTEYNGHTVILTYFPSDAFRDKQFY